MDIASLSIYMNEVKVMQQVSIAVTAQAMEMQQTQAQQLINVLETPEQATHPYLGATIDLSI